MDFNIVDIFNRSVTFEMNNDKTYNCGNIYDLYVNGDYEKSVDTNVFSLYNLRPDTEYQIELRSKNSEDNISSSIVCIKTLNEVCLLDVKEFGAVGDGKKEDTLAIQAAIACCPKDGTVRINRGTYLTGPLFLKSDINIYFEEGATLLALTDRDKYPIIPGMVRRTDDIKDEISFTSWEGNPLSSYASLITGQDVSNVNILGPGLIDGNSQNSDWWVDVRNKRGAWRPKLVELTRCKNIKLQGVKFQNSPCWAIHPYYSDDISFYDCCIYNPDNSPNTDGIDPENCCNVNIIGVKISVGDDCVALKSGKIYMSKYHYKKTENVTIRNCKFDRGHGAVTIGSEISCGVQNLNVSQCIFENTDRGLRIKSRRGRGNKSILENLKFSNIDMIGVHMPFTVNMFYFCDPDGHSDYVQCQQALPVDENTPKVGNIFIEDVRCEGVNSVFICIYGLPESHVSGVKIHNVNVSYLPEEKLVPMCPIMMDDFEEMAGRSIYIRNADTIELSNIYICGSVDSEPQLINVGEKKIEEVCYRNV